MAPIKLEEHIREKLQERELAPSPQAWEKLDAALGTPEVKKRSASWYWYAAAASLVGVLIVTSLFWKDSAPAGVEVVSSSEENPTIQENRPDLNQELKRNVPVASEDGERKDGKVAGSPTTLSGNERGPIASETKARNAKGIPSEDKKLAAAESIQTVPHSTEEAMIQEKIAEVVQQVHHLREQHTEVTVQEIDALLIAAQRDMEMRRSVSAPSTKIDAMALLDAVEEDLERSFRDKVFEALGEGFQKIRTAVVERNN
jgi:hypothetical protein